MLPPLRSYLADGTVAILGSEPVAAGAWFSRLLQFGGYRTAAFGGRWGPLLSFWNFSAVAVLQNADGPANCFHTHTHTKKVQGLLYMRRERERFVRGTCGLCAFVPVSSGDRVHFLVGMAELTSLNWDFSIQSKIQQADSEPACTETLKRCVFLFLLLWAMARTCPEACRRPS
jgi:hypothetical protein